MNTDTKQVIVVRKDLNMSKGKVAAQVAHASRTSILNLIINGDITLIPPITIQDGWNPSETDVLPGSFVSMCNHAYVEWLNGSTATVVVWAENESHLLQICKSAQMLGLHVTKIVDEGRTMFNGVSTLTCAAIGPDYVDLINLITRDLKLA